MIIETCHPVESLWYDPDSIREVSRRVCDGLRDINLKSRFDQVVITSKIDPCVGIMPLAGNISAELRKPLVVWKQTSGLLKTASWIVGSSRPGNKVAVIDSRTFEGDADEVITSLIKEGYLPVAYVSIVDMGINTEEEIMGVAKRFNLIIDFYRQPLVTYHQLILL